MWGFFHFANIYSALLSLSAKEIAEKCNFFEFMLRIEVENRGFSTKIGFERALVL